ncbi:MAG: hypothetical protein EBS86_00845, partial [Crocinitomicaceae bacterium]|nr:hypothetical protein [Crocinitomicaceae bacterium]
MFEVTSKLVRGDMKQFVPAPSPSLLPAPQPFSPLLSPDLQTLEDLSILRSVGVGFSEEEAMLIAESVAKLKGSDGIEGSMRFWGKI